MRICCATSGISSMLSLTMRTAPLALRTTFSRIGPNCLHGPHHGAQKSTMTGWSNEASTTSAMKSAVVTSLIGGGADAPLPPPRRGSFAIRTLPGISQQHGGTGRRKQALAGRRGALQRIEVEHPRDMAALRDEAQQVARRDRGGAVVGERMEVERVALEHRPVEHDLHALRRIVGKGERRHAARGDPE